MTTPRRIDPEAFARVWARLDIPTERIAAALGCSRQAVSQRAQRLGLPPRTTNRRPAKKGDDELFSRMWLAGVSTHEMAAHFGYTFPSSVVQRREMMGLPPRERGRGGHAGWGTITLAQFWEAELGRKMQGLSEDNLASGGGYNPQKKRAGKGLPPPPGSNRNPNDGGPGMAEISPYYDSAKADNQEKSENWQHVGDVAKRIVEKAGRK